MLDSHPDILCHHEVFNPTGIHRSLAYKNSPLSFGTVEERDRDPWTFMRRVYGFTDGASAVGFKLGPGGLYNWPLLSLFLAHRVRKIVLERRGWLHAYTSTLIARQTQVWSRPVSSSAGPTGQMAVRVEPEAFRRFVRKRQFFYLAAKTLLRSTAQPWMSLAYEDIAKPEAIERILRFLGARTDVQLTTKTEKQNSADLRDRISNLTELRAALAGTSFAAGLDGDEP
jgi:hypothetical protein